MTKYFKISHKNFISDIKFLFFVLLFCIITVTGYDFGEKVPECAGPFDKHTPSPIFPDKSDCTKYFECESGGYLIQKTCGDGTKFDVENKICVHKGHDQC